MTTVLLSGLKWQAVSPSIYTLDGYPVWLAYNGQSWYLAINDDYDGARPWPSRDCAAAANRRCFPRSSTTGARFDMIKDVETLAREAAEEEGWKQVGAESDRCLLFSRGLSITGKDIVRACTWGELCEIEQIEFQ